jgi:putative MATE family efflux protein
MKDLTNGSVSGNILRFAAPMLAGNLFQQTYSIVDSIIVGKYIGTEALAAVGASTPIIFALISFVIGIASGGTIVVAQYFGARDFIRVRRTIDTLYIFIFFASILITAIGISLSGPLFQLMKIPPEVLPQAKAYLNTFLLGTILLFGFNGTSAILRGLGDSVTPLVFLIISSILNIILVFVFVRYLHLGVQGAAWATLISQGSVFFAAIIYLNKTHALVKLRIKELVFDWEIFWKSFRIGLPSGFQQTFVSFGMIALMRIVSNFGTNVIAAYSVAGRIDGLAMLPAMNFGQALSTFVGQNIGANKRDRVRAGLYSTLGMSAAISIFITLVVLLLPHQLMSFFTTDEKVIAAGVNYLLVVGSCYIIFSTMFSFTGMLRGAGDTLIPMFITLFSLWLIRIPVAALLSGRMHSTLQSWGMQMNLHPIFSGSLQEKGIWWSIPLAWLIGAVFSYLYFRTGNWKKKSVVGFEE